jgi:hypothetical protein
MVKKVLVMLEEFSKKEIDQYLIEQVAKSSEYPVGNAISLILS